jgi:hypothetical protein
MPDLRINRFDGGITDHYVNGPINQSRYIDNFLINRNGKLVKRPGWRAIDGSSSNIGSIPAFGSYVMIGQDLFNYLFEANDSDVHVRPLSKIDGDSSASQDLTTTLGSNKWPTTNFNQAAFHEWRNQIFFKPNNYTAPWKIRPTSQTFNTPPNKRYSSML